MDLHKLEQELQKSALSEEQARELREAMTAFGRQAEETARSIAAASAAMVGMVEREVQIALERADT